MRYPDLPDHCPQCNHRFTSILRPQSKLQKKGVVLMAFAGVATVAWCLALFFMMSYFNVIVVPTSPGGCGLLGVIAIGPGFGLGLIAMTMRCVRLRCPLCRWTRSYKMEWHSDPKRQQDGESKSYNPFEDL